jgi:hypothetical protein
MHHDALEARSLEQVLQAGWRVAPVVVRHEMPASGERHGEQQTPPRFQRGEGLSQHGGRVEHVLQHFRAQDHVRAAGGFWPPATVEVNHVRWGVAEGFFRVRDVEPHVDRTRR